MGGAKLRHTCTEQYGNDLSCELIDLWGRGRTLCMCVFVVCVYGGGVNC